MVKPTYTAPPNAAPVLGDPSFAANAQGYLGWFSTFGTYMSSYATWLETEYIASLAAGTAAAPAIAFIDDTNTGIYRAGADILGLATGGTQRAALSSAGLSLSVPVIGTGAAKLGPLLCTVGGTANSITLTYGMAALATGQRVRFVASAANTMTASINLDGLGAIACRTITGVALPSGYIRTGMETQAVYDGTYWVVDRQIERGSNANGTYARFADGTQLCMTVMSGVDITTAIGSLYQSATLTWTFPAAFADTTWTGGGRFTDAAQGLVIHVTGAGSTSPAAIRAFTTSSTAARTLSLFAIGTWY